MSEARNHHYIPQGYLRGFGWKRSKHYMVVVHDFRVNRTYEANTRNIFAQRDFMRFEAKDRAPDWLEIEFGKLESAATEAIREVTRLGQFCGDNRNTILNLMALLAVRSPEQRENVRDFQERISNRVMDLVLESKERWDALNRDMEVDTGARSSVTYEQAKDFHQRGQYKIEVVREWHIQNEMRLFKRVLDLLGQRAWKLYIVSGSEGEFITTNRPVVLAFADPQAVPPLMRQSPGFAIKDTEVYFPLTKHSLLIGRWSGDEEAVSSAPQALIGVVNTLMIQYSYGVALSSSRRVLYQDGDMKLNWDEKMMDRFIPV